MGIKTFIRQHHDAILAIGIIGALTLGAWGAYLQSKTIATANRIASTDYLAKISDLIASDKYVNIAHAIKDNPSNHSLLADGFTQADIEDYIGNFETLGNLAKDQLIDPVVSYDALGQDVEKAWCNVDVQNIIAKRRTQNGVFAGPNAIYIGLENFARFSFEMDKSDCKKIDNQNNMPQGSML